MKSHNFNNPKPGSLILLGLLLFSAPCTTNAQITIRGAIFGGGKQGEVGTALAVSGDALKGYVASGDATLVTIKNGDIKGNIYGGGEKGNSFGRTNVVLQGGSMDSTSVYGGARMADVFGTTTVLIDGENIKHDMKVLNVYGGNDISGNITSMANVNATNKNNGTDTIYVHNLYGGGNGDYDYTASGDAAYGLEAPTLAKASINLESGCYDQIFGGGNKATIDSVTTITLNNSYALKKGKLFANGDTAQFGRVFGGNNKVAMAIQPTWNLTKASISNLYSGGNMGAMTNSKGIYLTVENDAMTITNMYGGCRMADVKPDTTTTSGSFYGAHVTVKGGKITNVYGGNDISGNVFYGSKLDILSSIIGDVYGGGNGSYAYTDKKTDSEFYYNPGTSSIDSLNNFRPNAEKVLMHIAGTASDTTFVGGSLYCGGNSATLRALNGDLSTAKDSLKIGSYVVMNQTFLGSNGVNMISDSILALYDDNNYSSLNLNNSTEFAKYMQGVEVAIKPFVSFDDGYVDYSTNIGSLYCGGNVGSMSAAGTFEIDFLEKLVIFNKLVGGCNNANVASGAHNAAHEGGLTTEETDKVHLLISGVQLEPKTLTYKNGKFNFATNRDANNRLVGGNIYGGCYQSGYVNGNVIIDIEKNALDRIASADIKLCRDSVLSTALSAFGGGYGVNSEIKGNTTINISETGEIVKVFGGGEMGKVSGNSDIYLTAGNVGKIYGGGFEGLVTGNTSVFLDGGTAYDAFAGACNANIGGSAKILLGSLDETARTHVLNNIYGGNDFGGTILTTQQNTAKINGTDKEVNSNTYVQYLYGQVDGSIYGGSCGSYDYSKYTVKTTAAGFSYPKFTDILKGSDINTNSFVDIVSPSENGSDRIKNIYGGGRGMLNASGIVDMNSTYVLLNSVGRADTLARNVFGGGYYSKVDTTHVEAISGYYGSIFGGTFGETATILTKDYASEETNVNTYASLTSNANLTVFGGGSYVGSEITKVTLYGGKMGYVYGGSFNEGYCDTTFVTVPKTSTVTARAIFGGGKGIDAELPCDVDNSYVTFASPNAFVSDAAIYGGNHSERATKNANITISSPVYKNSAKTLATIYGGGLGEGTITGTSKINLEKDALVQTVFGGGQEGKVYSKYDLVATGANAYYKGADKISEYSHWTAKNGLDYAKGSFRLTETEPTGTGDTIRGAWKRPEIVNGITYIDIKKGATVEGNVYGGGYGSNASVTGSPYVKLAGGTVEGNIYGGGYSGPVYNLAGDNTPLVAYCQILGGSVTNVYGGGFQGDMGIEGGTHMSTMVEIGLIDSTNYYNGNPTILRSAYGGGERAAVNGVSRVKMAGGYVGYMYEDEKYVANLSLDNGTDNENLKDNGNLYGAGYGEGAVVDTTKVYMYGGTVRNGLYGGGEIAAVGHGTTKMVNGLRQLDEFIRGGATHVYMYGGQVIGDVFGGGRGFSYDLTGNEVTGKEFYTDGYVFGSTDVNIYRGTVGTQANIRDGYGNVFGGGNIGYVYANPKQKNTTQPRYEGEDPDNYYYEYDETGDSIYFKTHHLSEDCRVLVTAYAKVTEGTVSFNSDSKTIKYGVGDYVPTEELHKLNRIDSEGRWAHMDSIGIIIENAVFAGGNVSAGSDKIYANTTTIYGNATASVVDLYPKDFILISNDGIGGLYGDGNLTFVDGYRELNITNYGTDYYSLNHQISDSAYQALTRREKAYYELKYECKDTYSDINGFYEGELMEKGRLIPSIEYAMMDSTEQSHWKPGGFTTLYSGRMMNTIQRCDFCGVFGSRMILRGAQDRVPDVVDYTNYTINRVSELSLNKSVSPNNASETQGNYFGIFNVVNLLGAITSDVDFQEDTRVTTSIAHPAEAEHPTYMDYKIENVKYSYRNNGSSHNMIALASGVFLELVDSIDAQGRKNYGPVTGVIELDLLNVKTGEGGGYVYARNIHGKRHDTGLTPITLSEPNANAVANKAYRYDDYDAVADAAYEGIQTSGNFVHSAKRIVDDCHPDVRNPKNIPDQCHYWYIKGDFYVYNQEVDGWTNASNAFTTDFRASMVVTPQANGKMELVSVKSNWYAYFIGQTHTNGQTHIHYDQLTKNDSIYIESTNTQYRLNDPISDWDYQHLTETEKKYFTKTTYVVITDAYIDSTSYTKGDVLTPAQYALLPETGYDMIMEKDTTTAYLVRETNAISNQKGFLLTLDFNNPENWDKYYTLIDPISNPMTISTRDYNAKDQTNKKKYVDGASMMCDSTGIFGQQEYESGFVTSAIIYNEQKAITDAHSDRLAELTGGATQATFDNLYVATEAVKVRINNQERSIVKGGYISESEWALLTNEQKASFSPGWFCTKTVLDASIVYGELVPQDSLTDEYLKMNGVTYLGDYKEKNFAPAYICVTSGKFGGRYFEKGQNYQAVDYCDLDSVERRKFFHFNYDAFDALRADFKQDLSLFSHPEAAKRVINYSDRQNISYEALAIEKIVYKDSSLVEHTIRKDSVMSSVDYEMLPNEVAYWRPIDHKYKATYKVIAGQTVTIGGQDYSGDGSNNIITESQYDALTSTDKAKIDISKENVPIYVIKSSIEVGERNLTSGHTITKEEYESLDADGKKKVDVITIKGEGRVYYCVEDYKIGERGGYDNKTGTKLTYWPRGNDDTFYLTSATSGSYNFGDSVKVGTLVAGGSFREGTRTYDNISDDRFQGFVPDYQLDFQLVGESPMEVTTLYVPRQSVILDYNEDRIVTVIYQYNYTEVYDNGLNMETQEERHIFNIRIKLKDGIPTIGEIPTPATVLPNTTIGITPPSVVPGAQNIIGGGFEIFENEKDAKLHRNGQPYKNNETPMFWYNDGYQVAYYAKTYNGKTYSNPVTLSVANYHRLEEVMANDEYLHIDTAIVKRAPKIYVDDHTLANPDLADEFKNLKEIDLLSELFKLSVDNTKNFNNDGQITGLKNTEIIIQSNVEPTYDWADGHQLGNAEHCFDGIIHGQGHTITGLTASLIGKSCYAQVYNLGVTGSFTKGGISDLGGYAENTWVSTSEKNLHTHPIIAVADPDSIVNSYYDVAQFNGFTSPDNVEVIGRTATEFLDGSVAFNLNRNYLEKRYQDTQDYSATGFAYKFMRRSSVPSTPDTLIVDTAYYSSTYASFRPWDYKLEANHSDQKMGYIEHYYSDGDYRYSKGEIRTYLDERQNTYHDEFMPIWPDDYILFGQTLVYNVTNDIEHDTVPTAALRTPKARYNGPKIHGKTVSYENYTGRLTGQDGNRVLRAQGYYGSSEKLTDNMVYFNTDLALDDSYEGENIHHNLTALDLTGHNGTAASDKSGGYMPELDYDGLTSVRGVKDLTRNLLIYAPDAKTDSASMAALKKYFREPDMNDYFQKPGDNYSCAVALTTDSIKKIFGHIVEYDGSKYVSTTDQYLVDGNDFNAPVSYKFTGRNYMWYQRKPDAYVTSDKSGWETISLPFTADTVTTSQKGIITHFYEGDNIGHEYWLREFEKVKNDTVKFKSPAKDANASPYKITNTFLYDRYYNFSKDDNDSKYQTAYGADERTFNQYPLFQGAKAYLIGFPGKPYYEFDMSGSFEPEDSKIDIDKISAQTITFISKADAVIGVSDEDYANRDTVGTYAYSPTYQSLAVKKNDAYLLDAEGHKFAVTAKDTVTAPFRAYFVPVASTSGAQTRGEVSNALFIGYTGDVNELDKTVAERGIKVWGEHMNIHIESTLEQPVAMDIVTVAGRVIKHVTVLPGAKVTVPVNNRGVYLVGHKKVAVTK